MTTSKSREDNEILGPLQRINTRIFKSQHEYVKNEVIKSRKGRGPTWGISEGDVYRTLLQEAITNRKKK